MQLKERNNWWKIEKNRRTLAYTELFFQLWKCWIIICDTKLCRLVSNKIPENSNFQQTPLWKPQISRISKFTSLQFVKFQSQYTAPDLKVNPVAPPPSQKNSKQKSNHFLEMSNNPD
jgi:hypothetical protein